MKRKAVWMIVLILLGLICAGIVGFVVACRTTDIPKIYLTGDISQMESKKDVRNISFRYDDGKQRYEGYASIKVQGTSSLFYEKKNYTVKFYQDAEHSDKMPIDVGWGEQYQYCMKANWIDRTHARNVVSAKLAGQMQRKYGLLMDAPNNGLIDGFPVEIYSNGMFLGLYTFNIPKSEWQFSMDKDNENNIVICGEGWQPANLFLDTPNFETWSVEVGPETEQTLQKMQRLFDFVVNSSDEEFREHFEEYLNLDSVLNYYVFADFAYLADNLGKNMLLGTYDGAQWYLSLYDLDASWGTDFDGLSLYSYENGTLRLAKNNLFARVEKTFPKELAQRYFELREDILTKEDVLEAFEEFENQIPKLTFVKEYLRWGSGIRRSREELPGFEYDQIEAFLDINIPRLDEKYSAMLTP